MIAVSCGTILNYIFVPSLAVQTNNISDSSNVNINKHPGSGIPEWRKSIESIIPALIGAISGSLGGNYVSYWLKKRDEKQRLRNEITVKHIIQLQWFIEAFVSRLGNVIDRGGRSHMRYIKGNDEYYVVSTLYSLGCILAYHRILLLEGVYSQIEYIYPGFGNSLITKLDRFGKKLDNLEFSHSDLAKRIKFFSYDRIALGDAITEKENGSLAIISYLKFKNLCESNENIKSSLEPARQFVESLSPSDKLQELNDFVESILKELEQITKIKGVRFA